MQRFKKRKKRCGKRRKRIAMKLKGEKHRKNNFVEISKNLTRYRSE